MGQVGNVLLHAAHSSMIEYSHPWLDSINHFFAVNGLHDLFNKLLAGKVTKGVLKKQLTQRLSDIYRQNNTTKLGNKPYLMELHKLTEDTEYKIQPYLKNCNPPEICNIYSRERTNSSKLSPIPYIEISGTCTECGVICLDSYGFVHKQVMLTICTNLHLCLALVKVYSNQSLSVFSFCFCLSFPFTLFALPKSKL